MRKSISKITLAATFGLALAFTFGCSGGGDDDDSCNISGYKTKQIGTQTWMAENLNCNVSGSVCYNNDPANCAKYGRLYDWKGAKKACPAGWHLPSNEEWDVLVDYAGGDNSVAGTKLKATKGWNNSGNGTDDYGFSALPGGYGFPSGYFGSVGNLGYWWSATAARLLASFANNRRMAYDNNDVLSSSESESDFLSVRCVQD